MTSRQRGLLRQWAFVPAFALMWQFSTLPLWPLLLAIVLMVGVTAYGLIHDTGAESAGRSTTHSSEQSGSRRRPRWWLLGLGLAVWIGLSALLIARS